MLTHEIGLARRSIPSKGPSLPVMPRGRGSSSVECNRPTSIERVLRPTRPDERGKHVQLANRQAECPSRLHKYLCSAKWRGHSEHGCDRCLFYNPQRKTRAQAELTPTHLPLRMRELARAIRRKFARGELRYLRGHGGSPSAATGSRHHARGKSPALFPVELDRRLMPRPGFAA